ncbi:MAG: hypothetical protein JW870_13425 [Candidatus Delongbacteria bacterium]|nr:hypothetical protein [Candidatus Delongbacteria bacterium]
MKNQSNNICYICGKLIDTSTEDEQFKLSMDHVPPKQFFPKQIRQDENLNLELVPSHKKCNNDYKDDEEYFYHSLYPLVANVNPIMSQVIYKDFVRKSRKPQTPALIRRIFSSASTTTQGGIILPHHIVVINIDEIRIQKVAGKIARGVLFLETQKYLPPKNIVDMRMCENESDVPEMYQLSWQASSILGSFPKVFSYKYFQLDNLHIISLLFWESFMFCIAIQEIKSLK